MRKEREATAPIQLLVKRQPWFRSLRWKTCLRQNCSLGSCVCSEEPTLRQNNLIMIMMIGFTKRNAFYNVRVFCAMIQRILWDPQTKWETMTLYSHFLQIKMNYMASACGPGKVIRDTGADYFETYFELYRKFWFVTVAWSVELLPSSLWDRVPFSANSGILISILGLGVCVCVCVSVCLSLSLSLSLSLCVICPALSLAEFLTFY